VKPPPGQFACRGRADAGRRTGDNGALYRRSAGRARAAAHACTCAYLAQRHCVGTSAVEQLGGGAVAAESWERIGDHMHALQTDSRLLPSEKLRAALMALITVSRQQPHLYQLMFSTPGGDPAAAVRAAQRSCDEFLAIAAAVVDEQNAQRFAAVLLTGAHGAAGLEMSGLLTTDKWHTTAEELTDTLIAVVAEADR
jgi:hypothetical protein